MYLQEILEVAIGLVFVWLVMSLAAMQFNEWIANGLEWRANRLEQAIQQMLVDKGKVLTKQLYEHPLISNLYPSPKKPGKKTRLPSYIPADKFAAALFDLVINAGTDASPIKNLTAQIDEQLKVLESPEQQKLAKEDWEAILATAKQVAASNLGESVIDSLKAQITAYGTKYPEFQTVLDQAMPEVDTFYHQFQQEQRAIAAEGPDLQLAMRQFHVGMMMLSKTNAKLKDSIAAVLRSVEGSALKGEQAVATARASFETWFNDAMDRLSGYYKRQAQLITFLIGFGLALILNVDTIFVATSLWREPTLRQSIIAQANAYAQQNQQVPAGSGSSTPSPLQTIPELKNQLQTLNLPFGWTAQAFDTGGKKCSLVPFVPDTAWGIPSRDDQGAPVCQKIGNLPTDIGGWLTKFLGFAITGAATAQGAPFWFDILKKLINVRGSGPNPSEKPVG